MLSLAGRYDTAVLVSGDEDFVYAVNAVAYKGCRVEIAGFRSNTAPKLIDVADYFIDLGKSLRKFGRNLLTVAVTMKEICMNMCPRSICKRTCS
jgi:uncharacterized LabA/DUF88 family protein